jgi:SAM-dependent methyltransferase
LILDAARRLSGWLAAQGYEVVGVDSSGAMLEAARRNTPDVAFRLSHGAVIPGEAATFGVIVSVGVLQYMVGTDAYVPMLGELGRVLRRDGTLLAIEHVGDRDGPGRGGQLEEYARGLSEADWVISISHAYPVRRSDSHAFTQPIRQPRLANLPGLERIVALDARMRPKPLTGARYVDYLFVAHQQVGINSK